MAELPTPLPSRAMIGRWNTDQYFHVLRWPAIVLAVLMMAAILTQRSQVLVVIFEILGAGWIGWLVVRSHGRRMESLTAGAVVGLIMGLTASLARFVLQPSLSAIFGGISETLLTGLIISLLTASAGILFALYSTSKP